jgi:hypothetical protein
MKNERKMKSVVISAMVLFALLAVFTASASASGGITDTCSPDLSTSGSSSPLSSFYSTTIYGDYVAAGVGMRGTGSGTITISGIPGGSTIVKAVLYWAIVDTSPESANFKNGVFAGTAITGTLIGTDDDPCWGGTTTTYAYRADVTSLATGNGAYALSRFATGPLMPQTGYGEAMTPPLCEGASLVVVYSNPSSAYRDIVIYDGADTIDGAVSSISTVMTGFTASAAPSAKTTYIVADGQDQFSDDTLFNGVTIASDTAAMPETTSFEGTDGKLWDTDTYDVSAHVSAGDTSCTVKLQMGSDCLVHIAQVFSVTRTIEVVIDIKPGSYPNSININSKGVIPVAILTTDDFDAADVDPETVRFGPAEARPVHYALEDVDGDGDIDMILHFKTQETGIAPGDTEASLTGETYSGHKIVGTDSVRVIDKGKGK